MGGAEEEEEEEKEKEKEEKIPHMCQSIGHWLLRGGYSAPLNYNPTREPLTI